MDVNDSDLREAIKRMMDDSGCNVTTFAARHGFSRVTMSNVINGNKPASDELLSKLGVERVVLYRIPAKYKPDKKAGADEHSNH